MANDSSTALGTKRSISNKELTSKLVRAIESCISEQSNAIIVSDSYTRIFEYMTLLESIISDTPTLKKQFTKNDPERQHKDNHNDTLINHLPIKTATL